MAVLPHPRLDPLHGDDRLGDLVGDAAADPRPGGRPFTGDLAALRTHLASGRDLLPSSRPHGDEDLFPTALPAVDALLAGGLPRGCLTELRGAPSSGRLSFVLALLAAATARGEAAALVDLGDQLDPQAAAAAGVELARLLWVRPRRLREALAATEIALGGAFPLVVLELGAGPVRGGRDEHAWLRLARAARHHRGALLVAAPYRTTGSAAAEVLALSSRRGVWLGAGAAPRLLAGVDSRLRREKSRRQPQPATAAVAWRAAAVVAGARAAADYRAKADHRSAVDHSSAVDHRPAVDRRPAAAVALGKAVPARPGAGLAAARAAAASAAAPTPRDAGAANREPRLPTVPLLPSAARPSHAELAATTVSPTKASPTEASPTEASSTKASSTKASTKASSKTSPTAPPASSGKTSQPATPGALRPPSGPRPLPGPPWPARQRRVPRWVPLARAALAESMRGTPLLTEGLTPKAPRLTGRASPAAARLAGIPASAAALELRP
jgi:hypothetical protein